MVGVPSVRGVKVCQKKCAVSRDRYDERFWIVIHKSEFVSLVLRDVMAAVLAKRLGQLSNLALISSLSKATTSGQQKFHAVVASESTECQMIRMACTSFYKKFYA